MDEVFDLDIETFDRVLQSILRNEYHEKTESAWTAMVAAQGNHKGMSNWTSRWSKILRGGDAGKDADTNLDSFLKLVGTGF